MSDNIAIRLPASTSDAFGEGPGHSVTFWETPWGRFDADWLYGDMRDWATDIVVICETRMDGRKAELIRYLKWAKEPRVALRVDEGPFGFLIDVPATRKQIAANPALLRALLSVRFINDPDKLIVTHHPSDADGKRRVMVENEVGVRSVLKERDTVTNQQGILKEIRDHEIVVEEYVARAWRTVLIPIRDAPKP